MTRISLSATAFAFLWFSTAGTGLPLLSAHHPEPSPASDQTISFPVLSDMVLGAPPFGLSAASTSSLPVAFTVNSPSVCSLAGTTVTLASVGICSITASQPGNINYNPAVPLTRTFNVLTPAPFYGLTAAGQIDTIAGNGGVVFEGDGLPAINSAIGPRGVVVDAIGNFYIADTSPIGFSAWIDSQP